MNSFYEPSTFFVKLLCVLSMLPIVYFLIVPTVALAQTYAPPSNITVQMFALQENGASTGSRCTTASDPGGADDRLGCTAYPETDRRYPYPGNPATMVPIETDYLLDVLPQEMGPYYHPTALLAQAIAARSYAYYKIDRSLVIDNSSSGNQTFLPYRFEFLNKDGPSPDNQANPCQSTNLNPSQQIICTAVASQHYITDGAPPTTARPLPNSLAMS